MEIKTSVREIVELIYGSGDLISEGSLMKRAEEGTIIHKEHQSKYKETDQSEVYVDYNEENEKYTLFISGRIDGVIKRGNKTIIEEIKSTTKDLDSLDETTTPAHLAQAKFYAYFYGIKNNRRVLNIRLTYIHVESRSIKEINFKYTIEDLKNFFNETISSYMSWLFIIDNHEELRNKTIEQLTFPFNYYRSGQRDLMGACYKTILSKDILYAIAPTGVGKTIATIFSSLKAINQKNQKIFYLTAKNLGKQVALNTIKLLMNNNLTSKACEITSKDNICLLKERDCDPEKCPFSKGYYNKIFNAIQDLFQKENIFSKEVIVKYARKHMVCPFEFSLDISYYADIIICDYNYAFCPITHLIRYFDDETKYVPILLVDEAHNLVSRSKDMYSASISKIKILTLLKLLRENSCNIKKEFTDLFSYFDKYENDLENQDFQVIKYDDSFTLLVLKLYKRVETYINDHKKLINKNEIMKIFMELIRFSKIIEYFDSDYIFAIEKSNSDIIVNLSCLDASKFLLKTIKEKTLSSIFFSATLYPIEYYKTMLTQNAGKYIRIDSPFDQSHLNLITINDVSTRYKDRENSIEKIVDIIRILGNSKVGNYIVFFPSYKYLDKVYQELLKHNYDFDYIEQKKDYSLKEREEIINLFKQNDHTQIGLFVMGGMFAEGIDYIGDMLSGVIIVGTGLPMVGGYNNVVKSHFDLKFGNGFDFAYTYPGFSKVVQAVGRVIRTETDCGIAILIDDRFALLKYYNLYPKEWSHMKQINNLAYLSDDLNQFWIDVKEKQ